MILFDPAGRLTCCTEAARVVDSVIVFMNKGDVLLEDGDGRIVVFRTYQRAQAYRDSLKLDRAVWEMFDFYPTDVETLILNRPHICIGE